jgi:fatty-acyl-CoA synthase
VTEFNLAVTARAVAEAIPEAEFLVSRDTRLTFAEMSDRSSRFGRFLVDRDFSVHSERSALANYEIGQDTLGLYLHNCPEFLIANLGAYEARAVPFNINYRYVAEELTYLVRDSDARGVVFHSTFAETLAHVLGGTTGPLTLVQVPDDSGNALLPGAVWFDDALAQSNPDPGVEPSPDDIYMIYTGGTTGMPKGVLWRQADVFVAAMGGRNRNNGEEWPDLDAVIAIARKGGTRLMPLPPFMHGAGQWACFNALMNGSTVVLPNQVVHLDPVDIWSTVDRERVNTLVMVGDAFARPLAEELERGDYDLSSLNALVNAGAPLHVDTKRRMLELLEGRMIIDTLGSSETGAQASAVATEAAGSQSGRFTPGTDMAVVDSTRTRLAEPGEDDMGWLAQRGRLPLGYLGDPDKTAATFPVVVGERMALPGDRAQLDEDGNLVLHGRDSVTINSGGEKIFAEEVEQALMVHPAVVDTVVCGRPSERWGSEVCAVVALRGDVGDDELLATASESIARYKLPKLIVRRDVIVRSPAGKADYRWAREQVADEGS